MVDKLVFEFPRLIPLFTGKYLPSPPTSFIKEAFLQNGKVFFWFLREYHIVGRSVKNGLCLNLKLWIIRGIYQNELLFVEGIGDKHYHARFLAIITFATNLYPLFPDFYRQVIA